MRARVSIQAATVNHCDNKRVRRQSGVALLQVLLISSVISLLAIRFTETARDQILIASQFEDRILAQLAAYSVTNEVIFTQIVDVIEPLNKGQFRNPDLNQNKLKVNLWGGKVNWSESIAVTVQDLNGLAPQMYPNHIVWQSILSKSGLDISESQRILGEWADIQDPDTRSWKFGEIEPAEMSRGTPYLNGYAQSEVLVSWMFESRPDLLAFVLDVSSLYSPMKTNFLHSSPELLNRLFEPEVADSIISARSGDGRGPVGLQQLIPDKYSLDYIIDYRSPDQKITVRVVKGEAVWQRSVIVRLNPRLEKPFTVLKNG